LDNLLQEGFNALDGMLGGRVEDLGDVLVLFVTLGLLLCNLLHCVELVDDCVVNLRALSSGDGVSPCQVAEGSFVAGVFNYEPDEVNVLVEVLFHHLLQFKQLGEVFVQVDRYCLCDFIHFLRLRLFFFFKDLTVLISKSVVGVSVKVFARFLRSVRNHLLEFALFVFTHFDLVLHNNFEVISRVVLCSGLDAH
jgi:hypothetical protein